MRATVIAMRPNCPRVTMVTTTGSKSTMALADLLIALREPVPVSDAQIARGTARAARKRRALLGRRRAPAGEEASSTSPRWSRSSRK